MFELKTPNKNIILIEDFIFEIEKQLRPLAYEVAVAIHIDKHIVMIREGEKDRIIFQEIDKKILKNTVFTHNHPQNTPHSPEDLIFAYDFELKEIRVVTQHNIFSISPSEQGWKHWVIIKEIEQKRKDYMIEQYKEKIINRAEIDELYNQRGIYIAEELNYAIEIITK